MQWHAAQMPGSDDLSLGKVGTLCQVSRSTVYRWVVSGQLKAYNLPSGHFRVHPADLSHFCQANGVPDPFASVETSGEEGVAHQGDPAAAAVETPATVLVVDDQPAIRLVMSRLVQRLLPSVRLVEATNGIEACIRIGSERPNLILLDIMMPGMDGFGVVQELMQQEDLRDVEVVIISAYEPYDRLQYLERQHKQVIGVHRKPIALEQLRTLLEQTTLGQSALLSGS
jgi:CheY-like chemotaxis protein